MARPITETRWLPEHDRLLRDLWPTHKASEICKIIPWHPSRTNVYTRVEFLRLPMKRAHSKHESSHQGLGVTDTPLAGGDPLERKGKGKWPENMPKFQDVKVTEGAFDIRLSNTNPY